MYPDTKTQVFFKCLYIYLYLLYTGTEIRRFPPSIAFSDDRINQT